MRKKGNAYRNWWESLKKYLTVRKHNIKTRSKETGCDSLDFAKGKLAGSPERNNELTLSPPNSFKNFSTPVCKM